jgi:hypothetical protein
MYATLWRADGTGLRMYSEMHDVAEREEVGVLTFNYVSALSEHETIVDVRSTFGHELTAFNLVIHESGKNWESGVGLRSSSGAEILILAGAAPCLLAIDGLVSMPHVFEPEYPIDRYTRVPLA